MPKPNEKKQFHLKKENVQNIDMDEYGGFAIGKHKNNVSINAADSLGWLPTQSFSICWPEKTITLVFEDVRMRLNNQLSYTLHL